MYAPRALATATAAAALLLISPRPVAAQTPAGTPQRSPDRSGPQDRPGRRPPGPDVRDLINYFGSALFSQTPPSGGRAVIALRKLRDPDLRPLFSQLAGAAADSPNARDMRVQGILALAELNDPPALDLLLVRKVDSPRDRAAVVLQAMDQGLLTPDDMEEISRWQELGTSLRVLLLGRLQHDGHEIEPDRLRPALKSESLTTRIEAALLLGKTGRHEPDDDAPLREALTLGPAANERSFSAVIREIRRLNLARGRPIVEYVLTHPDTPPLLRFEAVWALLAIAPKDPEACAAFIAAFEHSSDPGAKIRLAMAALQTVLDARAPFGADVFGAIGAQDDDLLRAAARAGDAVASRSTDPEPILILVRQAHVASARWALNAAATLDADGARAVRLAVLDTGRGACATQPEYFEAVVAAAEALADSDPSALGAPLDAAVADGDARFASAVLTGALRARSAGAAAIADRDDWPDDLCEGLATILRARAPDGLGPDRYDALASIATGRGDLPRIFRIQAAWLAIKCRGEVRTALARVLADAPK